MPQTATIHQLHRPEKRITQATTWDNNPSVMGKSFIDRRARVVLAIGKDTWTVRQMVVDLKCPHFRAAGILSRFAKEHHVTGVRDLANRLRARDLLSTAGVGVTTVYLWMLAYESFNGDPLRWLDDKSHTLPTLKSKATRKDKPRKKAR